MGSVPFRDQGLSTMNSWMKTLSVSWWDMRIFRGVRQLLQFGDHIWVTDPPEAAKITADLASELAKRHSGTTSPES